MSGGHWNYNGLRIQEMLEDMGRDGAVKSRFPRLSKIFERLGKTLYEIEHELDYDLSGDRKIEDDTTFEVKAIQELKDIFKMKTELKDVEEEIGKLQNRLNNIKKEVK